MILDESIMRKLKYLSEIINSKKKWSYYEYDSMNKSLNSVLTMIKTAYIKETSSTLEDTSRRLFEGKQMGGIDIFINYYNGFLFIRKLELDLKRCFEFDSFST